MTMGEAFISVWQQALAGGKPVVELEGQRYKVGRPGGKKLRVVRFSFGDHQIDGIEQNPQTSSRWAELARQGKRVMQFKCQGRYVANVSEGKLLRYPAWEALDLPE